MEDGWSTNYTLLTSNNEVELLHLMMIMGQSEKRR